MKVSKDHLTHHQNYWTRIAKLVLYLSWLANISHRKEKPCGFIGKSMFATLTTFNYVHDFHLNYDFHLNNVHYFHLWRNQTWYLSIKSVTAVFDVLMSIWQFPLFYIKFAEMNEWNWLRPNKSIWFSHFTMYFPICREFSVTQKRILQKQSIEQKVPAILPPVH